MSDVSLSTGYTWFIMTNVFLAGHKLRALHKAELAHGVRRAGGRAGAGPAAVRRHHGRARAHGARLPQPRALP